MAGGRAERIRQRQLEPARPARKPARARDLAPQRDQTGERAGSDDRHESDRRPEVVAVAVQAGQPVI